MKKTIPNILILGGGVAGMSAARSLAGQAVAVHLVEKEHALGGHAAMWACMATGTCENCGACLSIEMADQAQKQKNLTLHLNTLVNTVKKKEKGYEVILGNKQTLSVEKIIMATGFSPFDPGALPSLHHGAYKNVITTAELNTLLKEETLSTVLNGKKDPSIAFIQCVGSRNRELGRDYCSQVCCKISMRHAAKLVHLYPEAGITLFYMDLQIIGKEIRPKFEALSNQISLVQGVPAEILENRETNMLTVMAEDKETQSRVARSFDLVVLSVGLLPSKDLEPTAGLLNLTPNSWGFFNTDPMVLPADVIIAGCANGPKDILSSQQDGRMAAAGVIRDLDLDTDKKFTVAVLGDGAQADQAAMAVASNGFPSFLFGPGKGLPKETPVTALNNGNIISVNGTAGNFSIYYAAGKEKKTLNCAAIIAAPEPVQLEHRLNGTANRTTSLDAFSHRVETAGTCPENTVILLDYFTPEFKSSARQALNTAVKARALGKTVSIIMNKMLVHGALGQRLYDTARQEGVDFFRFETQSDLEITDSGTGFLLKLKEATLPTVLLNIHCDTLVVPPVITPAKGFKDIAGLLGQAHDTEGFLQSANTRHRLTQSPRKGIFFAGSCHDEEDADDLNDDMNEILSAFSTQAFDLPQVDTGVEINQKKCAQCLTCIRICPHGAIVMNEKSRPQIVPDACFSCHLCVANCPAYAIESKTLTNDQVAGKIKKNSITVLACERSAALAAGRLTLPDHINLIEIPCACRISTDVILKALLNGASKVIVAGCHEENCRSFDGSRVAETMVNKVAQIPGMDTSKVMWEPVAANETKKFERMISKA